MSCISWNCHGLGNPCTVQFLKELILLKKPKFLFLCETICRKDKLDRLRISLGFEGAFVVDPQGKSGGLALFWRFEGEVRLLSFSQAHIDVEVLVKGQPHWRFCGVYGNPDRNCRHLTWDLLRKLATESQLPWCIMGDLNNVLGQEETRGGRPYPNHLI